MSKSEQIRFDMNHVTVTLSTKEFEAFTKYCKDHGFQKSGLIASIIRNKLEEEGYLSKSSVRRKVER